MPNRKNQTEHDNLVKTVANYLISQNFTDVKADIEGYLQPSKITWTATGEGHIPDVSAIINNTQHIYEIETEETISIEHTKNQFVLFSEFAKGHKAVFHIVVPADCKNDAVAQANEWGITAEVNGI